MFEFSNAGSPFREIRQPVVRDGKVVVEVVGKENFNDFINSFADSCDINVLVSRAVNGEPEVLNRRQGMYGDFTQFPKTYAEVLQRVINANSLFDSLPADIRVRFDNDVYKFISEMDNADWFEKAGFVQKKTEEVKEEVKE